MPNFLGSYYIIVIGNYISELTTVVCTYLEGLPKTVLESKIISNTADLITDSIDNYSSFSYRVDESFSYNKITITGLLKG